MTITTVWRNITTLFAGEAKEALKENADIAELKQRLTKAEATLTKLGDDVTALENIVPQALAQAAADAKKAETAQALADEAKAELATAEDPETTHRLEVQIEALTAFVASRTAPATTPADSVSTATSTPTTVAAS